MNLSYEVRSLQAGVRSDVGKVRDMNQDYLFVSEPYQNGLMIAIIADGMGGHLAGDVASKMATEIIYRELDVVMKENLPLEKYKTALEQALFKANQEVYQTSIRHDEYHGMGTTVVVAIIHENWIVLGHIGDSRAYLVDDGKIYQLTADHSLVNELVQNGHISQEEAISYPQKNILTRALGTEATIKVDLHVVHWEKKQTFILCTDGLTNHLSDQQIVEVVHRRTMSVQDKADHLIAMANQAGGEDNISVIIIHQD